MKKLAVLILGIIFILTGCTDEDDFYDQIKQVNISTAPDYINIDITDRADIALIANFFLNIGTNEPDNSEPKFGMGYTITFTNYSGRTQVIQLTDRINIDGVSKKIKYESIEKFSDLVKGMMYKQYRNSKMNMVSGTVLSVATGHESNQVSCVLDIGDGETLTVDLTNWKTVDLTKNNGLLLCAGNIVEIYLSNDVNIVADCVFITAVS